MKALLVQQRCVKAIDESWGTKVTENRRTDQDKIAWSTIFLHLFESVIREVEKTKTAIEI